MNFHHLALYERLSFGICSFVLIGWQYRKSRSSDKEITDDGYTIVGEPRTTGDGYYESIVEDPEGNWIEIAE